MATPGKAIGVEQKLMELIHRGELPWPGVIDFRSPDGPRFTWFDLEQEVEVEIVEQLSNEDELAP